MKTVWVVGSLAAMALAGCSVSREIGYPEEYISESSPTHVWVTMADSSVHELWNPTIHDDTLAGFSHGGFYEAPVKDVRLMRASVISTGRTAAVVAIGLVVVTSAVSYGLRNANGTSKVCYTPGTAIIEICPTINTP
jgi:hypothetical protein